MTCLFSESFRLFYRLLPHFCPEIRVDFSPHLPSAFPTENFLGTGT